MNNSQPGWNAGLEDLADEQLIVLIRVNDSQEAWNILIARCLRWAVSLMRRFMRGRLTKREFADAQQTILMALAKAIHEDFNLAQYQTPGGCSFRTFAGEVVLRRLIDFIRKHCRREAHHDRRTDFDSALEVQAVRLNVAANYLVLTVNDMSDPGHIAEVHEQLMLIEQALRRLHPMAWPLWLKLWAGYSLPECASILGMHYRAALRLRNRIGETVLPILGDPST